MWNSSALCRKAGLTQLISSASAYPSAKDVSEGLSLLFRRWATEIVDNSSKNLDPSKFESKMVTAGTSNKHLQGAQFHLYSYILASQQMEPGSMVMNCDLSKKNSGVFLKSLQNSSSNSQHNVGESDQSAAYRQGILDPNSQVGNCMPLADIRMGTWVHDIECHPGQGAKLARSAGTFAKVVKKPGSQCLLRLPSGVEKVVDSRCRATIGVASNPSHGTRKLKKAGENRWRGWRPVVRGVAMNPVDHPHGGGEGRTKGGRPSVSPWGKPTKAGFKTVIRKKSL